MLTLTVAIVAGMVVFWITASIGARYVSAQLSGGGQTAVATPAKRSSRSPELRRFRRFKSDQPVTISWQTDLDKADCTSGPMIDISEGGLAMKSPVALRSGDYVYIEIPHLQSATTANVRRCMAEGRRYVIGIEFRGPLFPKQSAV